MFVSRSGGSCLLIIRLCWPLTMLISCFFNQEPSNMFLFIIFMYNFAYRDFIALYKKNEASRVILKKYHYKVYGNPFNIASCIAYSYSLLLKE